MIAIEPETLANAFSREIHASLTKAELRLAIRRNKKEANPLVCHTHDFIDANMSMEAACNRLGLEVNGDDHELCILWCQAWEIAVAKGFKYE